MIIVCLNCGRPYPDTGAPFHCSNCGGLYDFVEFPYVEMVDSNKPGIYRYIPSFGDQVKFISLGEGNTPLISANVLGRKVFFKCEYANPTGSFKDRGSAILLTFLKSRGVVEAIEDSSGNAGASFAAYAARAGVKARVYVPEHSSGPKRKQIEFHGAELVTVAEPRSNAAEAALNAAEGGMVYASHAYLPFHLAGYATCAYEIVDQLGQAPGAVVIPAGQGGLLLGMSRGFQSLLHTGRIDRMPAIIGVQSSVCAPLEELFNKGMTGQNYSKESSTFVESTRATLAEGVQVGSPLRADAVIKITRESGGRFVIVDEEYILSGRDALARLGFYVEPTSALVWRALNETISELSDPVVAILTGSGYKVRA